MVTTKAQTSYTATVGIEVDFYDSATFFGPSIILIDDFDNIFSLRPHAGLDFKIDGVPIVVNFDWRPAIVLSESGDGEAGAFGFGLMYAFN